MRTMNNRVLMGLLAFIGAYWIVGVASPGLVFSALISACVLVAGVFGSRSYVPGAFDVIIGRREADISEGGHLAVLGAAMFSVGTAYTGLFGIAWAAFGDATWLGTVVSNFGRAMIAGGLFLLVFCAENVPTGLKPIKWWVAAMLVIVIATVAFVMGAQWKEETGRLESEPYRLSDNRRNCPHGFPVKGNETRSGDKFHVPGSFYYEMTSPEKCFATVGEAEAAGFRPPG